MELNHESLFARMIDHAKFTDWKRRVFCGEPHALAQTWAVTHGCHPRGAFHPAASALIAQSGTGLSPPALIASSNTKLSQFSQRTFRGLGSLTIRGIRRDL